MKSAEIFRSAFSIQKVFAADDFWLHSLVNEFMCKRIGKKIEILATDEGNLIAACLKKRGSVLINRAAVWGAAEFQLGYNRSETLYNLVSGSLIGYLSDEEQEDNDDLFFWIAATLEQTSYAEFGTNKHLFNRAHKDKIRGVVNVIVPFLLFHEAAHHAFEARLLKIPEYLRERSFLEVFSRRFASQISSEISAIKGFRALHSKRNIDDLGGGEYYDYLTKMQLAATGNLDKMIVSSEYKVGLKEAACDLFAFEMTSAFIEQCSKDFEDEPADVVSSLGLLQTYLTVFSLIRQFQTFSEPRSRLSAGSARPIVLACAREAAFEHQGVGFPLDPTVVKMSVEWMLNLRLLGFGNWAERPYSVDASVVSWPPILYRTSAYQRALEKHIIGIDDDFSKLLRS